ncbi:hypothetical protein [Vibrio sp. S11_S32]
MFYLLDLLFHVIGFSCF